jgi:hypothetical protein
MAEIKISDLSIGDWVEIDGAATKVWYLSEDSEVNDTTYDWVKPIPLTPEILEKNGFRKLDRFNEYVIGEWDSNPFIAVRLAEKFVEPTILVKKGGTSAHLFGSRGECVHQLQHALRSAGVEKEIEL